MHESESDPRQAERVVRDGLAAAARRRRARDASARLWRAAPRVAGVGLAVALLARWAGWPAAVPGTALAAGAVVLVLLVVFYRRSRPVTDAAAAAIDADANLRGELRSAGWFAARDRRDEWAQFHLEKAAARIAGIDWAGLYPSVRMGREQAAAALLAVAALALTVSMPDPIGRARVSAAGRADSDDARRLRAELLPPELQQELEALLAAAEGGNGAAAELAARDAELQELLNKLGRLNDPKLLEALARAMSGETLTASAAQDMTALAERARRAAESDSLPKEMKNALEKLAEELDSAGREAAGEDESQTAGSQGSEGDADQATAAGGMQDMAIQFARESEAGGGSGVLMMSNQESQQGAGPPGSGMGGAESQDATGSMTDIEAALKQEMVEASQDDAGENVETEIRRKTEHGNATVAYTRGATAAFDRSRAAAAPPVPEARRTGVQSYFIRNSQ